MGSVGHCGTCFQSLPAVWPWARNLVPLAWQARDPGSGPAFTTHSPSCSPRFLTRTRSTPAPGVPGEGVLGGLLSTSCMNNLLEHLPPFLAEAGPPQSQPNPVQPHPCLAEAAAA